MLPQDVAKTEADIRLPFLFILFALLSFLTALGLLMMKADAIIEGMYRSPGVWTATHLFASESNLVNCWTYAAFCRFFIIRYSFWPALEKTLEQWS